MSFQFLESFNICFFTHFSLIIFYLIKYYIIQKNTKTSFKYLTKFLNQDGEISIYVYNKKSLIREFFDDHIRETTVNMSFSDCMKFSKDMALLGKSLSKLKNKITITNDIHVLGIKSGTYDVQRFIYWHFLKCSGILLII